MRLKTLLKPALVLLALGPAEICFAHGGEAGLRQPHNWHELASAWEFDPGVVISLLVSAWLYVQGVARIWKVTHVGCGIKRSEVASFVCGWLTLVIALISPLHPWGRALFSAHMTQHELLMLVAAPLLVLGWPLVAFLKAL